MPGVQAHGWHRLTEGFPLATAPITHRPGAVARLGIIWEYLGGWWC
jgi:hypothetical protein